MCLSFFENIRCSRRNRGQKQQGEQSKTERESHRSSSKPVPEPYPILSENPKHNRWVQMHANEETVKETTPAKQQRTIRTDYRAKACPCSFFLISKGWKELALLRGPGVDEWGFDKYE